jgi:hypothetical protein
MSDNASPCAKSNPVVFTFVITAALAAAVLTGASLSGVASGAMQDVLRNAGFERNGEILAEQRRQTQALEKIEVAVGRVRADIALLHARFDEARNLYRAVSAAPVNFAPRDPAPGNPRSGPEFDLSALRASLDADAVSLGARASRPHPRRVGKGGPNV